MLLFSRVYSLSYILCLVVSTLAAPTKRDLINAQGLATAECAKQIAGKGVKGLAVCYTLGPDAPEHSTHSLDLIVMLNQVDVSPESLSLSISWPDQTPTSTPTFSLPQAVRIFEPLLIQHFSLPLPDSTDSSLSPNIKASSRDISLHTIKLFSSESDNTLSSSSSSAMRRVKRQETDASTSTRPVATTRPSTGEGILTLDLSEHELPTQQISTERSRARPSAQSSGTLQFADTASASATASPASDADAFGYRLGDGRTFRLPVYGVWLVVIILSAGSMVVGLTTIERRMHRKAFRSKMQFSQSVAEQGGAEKKNVV